MHVNRACVAEPVHRERKRFYTGLRPVVLSSKRYEGIMSRSRQDESREALADMEEQQQYKQYLKDGNDALCACFTNMGPTDRDDDEVQASRDTALAAEVKTQQTQLLMEQSRKKRILRANTILELMKPGPHMLHQALLTSEMIRQRQYIDAVNREIVEDAERQQRLDEQQCPAMLIPFGHVTEAQERVQKQANANAYREYCLKDLAERRERKLAEKEQETFDILTERAQLKCLQEKEQKEAKERAQKKREFLRSAYREALEEKARMAKHAHMCDEIDDRIICVHRVVQRKLDERYKKQIQDMRAKQTDERNARALHVFQMQQSSNELQARDEERYEAEVQMDEARRQCQLEELSKQRRAYELEERTWGDAKRLRDSEIRRFEIATRYKNEEANRIFKANEKKRKDLVTADLRKVLYGQRETFLEQRQEELMRITACQEDPHLQDDVKFFDDATRILEESKELGRPIYPLAKAVAAYRRENQIDMVPEGRITRRSRIRDYCWPGYHSKADLAYRKYEHREKCRQEQQKERHRIFDNCIKITKMTAEERPYKPCTMECPIKCFHHQGMPPIESVDSFDCGEHVCYEEDPPFGAAASDMLLRKKGGKDLQPKQKTSSVQLLKPKADAAKDRTITKTESTRSLAARRGTSSNRGSVGRGNSNEAASTGLQRSARLPDLTRYWTPKPSAQPKTERLQRGSHADASPARNLATNAPQHKPTWSKQVKQFD